MSVGYLVAAEADIPTARELADGFDLDVIDAAMVRDHANTAAALARKAHVGLLLSMTATRDDSFVSLARAIARRLGRAHLIFVQAEARPVFKLFPPDWPAMTLDEARQRATEAAARRADTRTAPVAATDAAATVLIAHHSEDEATAGHLARALGLRGLAARACDVSHCSGGDASVVVLLWSAQSRDDPAAHALAAAAHARGAFAAASLDDEPPPTRFALERAHPLAAWTGDVGAPGYMALAADLEALLHPARAVDESPFGAADATVVGAIAKAAPPAVVDASAYAPKKMRRVTPEYVRIVVHQPSERAAVDRAAHKIDPRTAAAPDGSAPEPKSGTRVGVLLETQGAVCDSTIQWRPWTGAPVEFDYIVDGEEEAKVCAFSARIFLNDAQVGVISFKRNIVGAEKRGERFGGATRLTRTKRVYIAHAGADREAAAQIAKAYAGAHIAAFWDRTGVKRGDVWGPNLRRQIDRTDLFHVCWSQAAARSELTAHEIAHALARRKRAKRPQFTVQTLDSPTPEPGPELSALGFDEAIRLGFSGYARAGPS